MKAAQFLKIVATGWEINRPTRWRSRNLPKSSQENMNPIEWRSAEEHNTREELTEPPGSGGLFMMGGGE